jgi:dTDP-4-amino-4,6-dideoxygalactose transaminase
MEWLVPLSDIDSGSEEEMAALDVLRSRWLTMGSVTEAFENAFAAYLGAPGAIAVCNATAGLHLACRAAGLGPGDEVILPSLTFVATAAACLYVGAKPVFADIESEDDLDVSPSWVEEHITPRTRAVIVMHYGGYACDMARIMDIAQAHGLVVIEDASHAPGGRLDNRAIGLWGDIGVFSFFSNKNMTTGEGGMLITRRPDLAERVRLLRSHAMTSLTWDRHHGHASSYDVLDLGYNYRIDELRSAIGQVQLAKLEDNNERRRRLVELYRQRLGAEVPDISLPFAHPRGLPTCHLMPVLLPRQCGRQRFLEGMRTARVQISLHYPPVHRFTFYRTLALVTGSLPITEDVADREVTLPLFPTMTTDQLDLVVEAVRHSLSTCGRL